MDQCSKYGTFQKAGLRQNSKHFLKSSIPVSKWIQKPTQGFFSLKKTVFRELGTTSKPTVHNLRPHADCDSEICGRPNVI